MDALRGTKVAEKEAGGITQNVAAFAVSMDAKAAIPAPAVVGAGDAPKATSTAAAKAASSASSASRAAAHVDIMTFLDTPGHALFASMRRRGTAVADIVVLVVDGKDGVMAQTKECIKIITDSGVPTVVAVTKCDVVESGPAVEKIAKQLMEYGIVCENFGGDVPIVGISAKVRVCLFVFEVVLAVVRWQQSTSNTLVCAGNSRRLCTTLMYTCIVFSQKRVLFESALHASVCSLAWAWRRSRRSFVFKPRCWTCELSLTRGVRLWLWMLE